MRWFSIIQLFFLWLHLQLPQAQKPEVFVQQILPKNISVDKPLAVIRDPLGRFWILTEHRLLVSYIHTTKDIEFYNPTIDVSGARNMHMLEEHKIVVLFERSYGIFDMSKNSWSVFEWNERVDFYLEDASVYVESESKRLKIGNRFQFGQGDGLLNMPANQDNLKGFPSFRNEEDTITSLSEVFVSYNEAYIYQERALYYINKSTNNVIQTTRLNLKSEFIRVSFPIAKDTVIICSDAPMDLHLVVNGTQQYKICESTQNKAYCKRFKNRVIYHVTNYNDQTFALLDNLGDLHLYDPKTRTLRYEKVVNSKNLYLKNIYTDSKDNLWLGSYTDHVVRYHAKSGALNLYRSEDCSDLRNIFRFYEDRDGWMWIGQQSGFVLYIPEKDTFYTYQYHEEKTPIDFSKVGVSAFGETKQLDEKLWIGSYSGGLVHIDKRLLKEAIALNKTNIWEDILFVPYHFKTGMKEKNIKYIVPYQDSLLFVRVESGAYRISHTRGDQKLSTKMGFPAVLNNNYNYLMADSTILVGANQGYAKIKVQAFDQLYNPEVIIQDVYFENKIQPLDYIYSINKKQNIRTDRNYIKITPIYADWYNQGLIQVRTKEQTEIIDNNDQFVFPLGRVGKNIIEFSSLKASPDPYRFNLELYVTQLWYKTLWFKILQGVLATVAIGGLVYYYRRQRLLQRRVSKLQTESLRSQMNPHFISNSLNSINLYVLENRTDEASKYIVKFSKLIRQILNNTRNEFISLSSELNSLEIYIQMEKMRFKEKFHYEIHIGPDVLMEYEVPSMLLQPLVENAIWHGLLQSSRNGSLEIHVLKRKLDGIQVTVLDDGVGINATQHHKSKKGFKRKSFGLDIVRQRIKVLNSIHQKNYSLNIEEANPDAPVNKGTKVIVNL